MEQGRLTRRRRSGQDASRAGPEVLQLLAEGQSTKGAAGILKISVKMVEMNRKLLMRRLQIRDLAGLVSCAMRMGLVDTCGF